MCCLQAIVSSPKNIQVHIGSLASPPLVIMTLNLRTLPNSKSHQNEVSINNRKITDLQINWTENSIGLLPTRIVSLVLNEHCDYRLKSDCTFFEGKNTLVKFYFT